MSAHLLGIRTGSAVFATDLEDQSIVIWQARELASLTLETFAIMVVDFFETASHWKHELNMLPGEKTETSAQIAIEHINYSAQRV